MQNIFIELAKNPKESLANYDSFSAGLQRDIACLNGVVGLLDFEIKQNRKVTKIFPGDADSKKLDFLIQMKNYLQKRSSDFQQLVEPTARGKKKLLDTIERK